MSTEDTTVTRRKMFAAGGLGALAIAGFAQGAQAADDKKHELSAAEKANVKIVDELCFAFNEPAKMAATLADDASVRMFEDKPAVIGPKAFLAEVAKISDPNTKYEVVMLGNWAKGPVVVNFRDDIVKTKGKPDQIVKVVGVFVVKKGKIKEWTDYIVT